MEIAQTHFRDRGKLVQVIRTSYDSTSKKGKNQIVGRLLKHNLVMSPQLDGALTDKERKAVRAWIEDYGGTKRLKRNLAARTLSEQMTLAEAWFGEHRGEDARVLAAAIARSWNQLRTLMKKNGLLV